MKCQYSPWDFLNDLLDGIGPRCEANIHIEPHKPAILEVINREYPRVSLVPESAFVYRHEVQEHQLKSPDKMRRLAHELSVKLNIVFPSERDAA